jgi:hypothetical protein
LRNTTSVTRLNGDLLAREERQRPDIEDVDQEEHASRISWLHWVVSRKKDPHILEQELAPGHRQPGERAARDLLPLLSPQVRIGAFLGLRVARRVEPVVQRRTKHQERPGGAPEQRDRQWVADPGEPVHDDLGRPFARHERALGRLQRRDELDEALESLRPRQLFRLHQAEQEHQSRRRARSHQAQHVAGAARGKDVHQEQRRGRADDRGKDEERRNSGEGHEREERSAVIDDPVRGEDREGEEHHHPR